MKSVGVYQAKTHLPSLLEKVKNGDSFEITRHGVPLARLVPIEESPSPDRSSIADALAAWKLTRKNIRLKGLTLKQLRDEGRR
jgi:prevent-host-death family protein